MTKFNAEFHNKHQAEAFNYIGDNATQFFKMFNINLERTYRSIALGVANELWLRERMKAIGEYLTGSYGEGVSEDSIFFYALYEDETSSEDLLKAFDHCVVAVRNIYATEFWDGLESA